MLETICEVLQDAYQRNWITSRNLIPWAVWIGGEELHNGHHADGSNPKFSQRWWEFDIGWMYICILRFFNLAKTRSTA